MKTAALYLALVSLPACAVLAQSSDSVADGAPPAPIVRHYQQSPMVRARPRAMTVAPMPGVRVASDVAVTRVDSAPKDTAEFRVEHGRANVVINHPEANALILLDLPGGQVDFVRDGFYTVNSDTGRVTVLHGEADVFGPGADAHAKGVTVHEGETFVIAGADKHPMPAGRDVYADMIRPGGGASMPHDEYPGAYGGGYPYGYGYGYYGGYPYYGYYGGYGWDYPYGYYGYGWGWPYYGWGLGWGWGGYGWGGGYWGGYRGGYIGRPGGFHPGGFGGHAGGFSGGGHAGGGGGGHR